MRPRNDTHDVGTPLSTVGQAQSCEDQGQAKRDVHCDGPSAPGLPMRARTPEPPPTQATPQPKASA